MAEVAAKQRKHKMSRLEKKNTLIAYSFLAPNFLGFAIFTLVPVVCAILLAFVEWNGGDISNAHFVGLQNFAEIFKADKVASKWANDDYLYFFNRVDLGIALKNTVFFPYVASMVAICVCWNFMLMKDGPVNQMIMALGINFNKSWTADSTMAMWAIILVSVWRSMGYYMVIYLAALQGVPRELYEAATVDGANKWQQFRNVTLPQIKPTTFFCTIMLVIGSFKIYDTVAIMTNGGPGRATKMLVTYIYDVAFNNIKYGQASAIAMVLLVIVLIVTIIQFANEKKFAND